MNLEKALELFSICDISTETEETLKKKYKKLMIKYHPDNYNGDDKKAKEISSALEIIKEAINKVKKFNLINTKKETYNIIIPLSKLIHLYNGGSITLGSDTDKMEFRNGDIQKHNTLLLLGASIQHNGEIKEFTNIQHWSISDKYEINCEIYVNNLEDTETIIISCEEFKKEFKFKSISVRIPIRLQYNINIDIIVNKKIKIEK